MALRPHLTFWLNVRPKPRLARVPQGASDQLLGSGRDMSLSHDLYWSFIRYQTMIKREFEVMAKRHGFIELDGEASVFHREQTASPAHRRTIGIRSTKYTPSAALGHLWR